MLIPTAALRQRVAIRPYLGDTALGHAFGPPIERKARFVGKRRMVTVPGGQNVVADATCDIRPDLDVVAESEVDHAGRTYRVLAVTDSADLGHTTHRQLILEGPR